MLSTLLSSSQAYQAGAWLLIIGMLILSAGACLDMNTYYQSRPIARFITFIGLALYSTSSTFEAIRAESTVRGVSYGTASIVSLVGLVYSDRTLVFASWCMLFVLARAFTPPATNMYVCIPGFAFMVGSWFCSKYYWGFGKTMALWLVVYLYFFVVGLQGISVGLKSSSAFLIATAAPAVFLPPLVAVLRKRLFSLIARRFESKQRLQDG